MALKMWVILVSCVFSVYSAPARPGGDNDGTSDILYDQSQTGDYNIQISLKDIQIIALLGGSGEEYTDYDYNYDYSELTIKPQNRTTTTPIPITNVLNVTSVIRNSTEHLNIASTTENVVKITPAALGTTSLSTSEYVKSSTTPKTNSVTILAEVLEQNGTLTISSDPVMTDIANGNNNKCVKGFRKTKNGECALKLRPSNINSLRKLVELSQRLKSRKTSETRQRNK